MSDLDIARACESVFTEMNSTPPNWSSIMRLTALPPPPPTPTTLIPAVWGAPSSSSKIIVMSPRPDSEEILEPPPHWSEDFLHCRCLSRSCPQPTPDCALPAAVEPQTVRYRHSG